MKTRVSIEALAELTANHAPPCLSLYQTTHRSRPNNQQDPIRFRNLVKQLETSLRQQHTAAETHTLLLPFEALSSDRDFWNHTLDGLAVLGAAGFFRVFCLQRAVPELAIVADSFHTKPLRRFLQSVDRYQVLGLSRGRFQIFEGDRNTLDEILPLAGAARSIAEVLGEAHSEPSQTSFSHAGSGASAGIHHGQGGKSEGVDVEADRFFRSVDHLVLAQYSKPSGLPLILAALPEHHHRFRQISHNPFLLDGGLHANPEGMAITELAERVWEVVEPQHRARQLDLIDEFSAALSKGLGGDNLNVVAQAAAEGRVAKLLIESGRQISGRLDAATGLIRIAALNDPTVDDLLDDLGELVVKMGGEVRVLPASQMPGSTGLAATYRH
ncbi:MAG: hypothetical protein M0P19_05655 [Nevskia sp.]|jgi:hypothetical protein|nr:hypothetical protein [Nevskia sp.]MCK9386496.1 hypothetical protein [Nevskia sp.]